MPVAYGAFNARAFALACLVLSKLTHCVAGPGGLLLNGNAGIGEGNFGPPHGILHESNPHSHPQGRDRDRSGTLASFAFAGGDGSPLVSWRGPDGEGTENHVKYEGAVVNPKERTGEGIAHRIDQPKDVGVRLSIPEDPSPNSAINPPAPEALRQSARDAKGAPGESEGRGSWKASSVIRSARVDYIVQQHRGEERDQDDWEHAGLHPGNGAETDTEDTNYGSRRAVPTSHHASLKVARSTGHTGASENGTDAPSALDDSIVFPDELQAYNGEESADDSPVDTYFFIRTPLRNTTRAKCEPNERFFRGRCRTYLP